MTKITNVAALEYVLDNYDVPAEYAEKLTKIRDTFANKGTNRKPTARQTENVELRADVKAIVSAAPERMTASDVLVAVADKYADISLPRVSAALTALVKAGEVTRVVEKKKAYFEA